jgi:hypothetical protein
MVWNKILHLVLASSLMFAQSTPPLPERSTQISVDELLSYECAKSVTSLVGAKEQTGPLFSEGQLVFTSVEADDHSMLLLLNAGHGNYVVPLEGAGVNRLRFEMKTSTSTRPTQFYLSYMHGGLMRSRYFEYAEEHPPTGHDEFDYSRVSPQRAGEMLPHLDYAINETAQATLTALIEGHLTREQLGVHHIENCSHLSRQSGALARYLKYNLDKLDLLVMGPQRKATATSAASRMPASIR